MSHQQMTPTITVTMAVTGTHGPLHRPAIALQSSNKNEKDFVFVVLKGPIGAVYGGLPR